MLSPRKNIKGHQSNRTSLVQITDAHNVQFQERMTRPTIDEIVGNFARQVRVKGKKLHLFISYAWDVRKEAIHKVADYLRKEGGYHVWIAKDNITNDPELYEAMARGIDAAQVVLCFYSNAYAKYDSCRREIQYAANKKRKIMPIRVEPGYEPDNWLRLIFQDRRRIDYFENQSFQDVSDQIITEIQSIDSSDHSPTVNAASDISSVFDKTAILAGVPYFSEPNYYDRSDLQKIILKDIKKVSKDLEGMLVLYGDDGVGKSTVLARLLHDPLSRQVLANSYGIHRVIWMNCFQWIDFFDEKSFYEEITELASEMDSELTFDKDESGINKFSQMVGHFKVNKLGCAFVFDDVYNGELIESFLKNHGNPTLIALTRDLQVIEDFDLDVYRKTRRVEGLSDLGIKLLFKSTFQLDKYLNDTQLQELTDCCYGLTLIADLIACHLNRFNVAEVLDAYQDLIANYNEGFATSSKQLRYKGRGRAFKTIFHLLSNSFDRMDASLRISYYAFLIYHPSEPVSTTDLAVLWNISNAENASILVKDICKQLENNALLRRVQPQDILEENRYAVHQTLYECSIEKAAADLGLPDYLSKTELLYNIRVNVINGEINRIGMPAANKVGNSGFLDSNGLRILVNAVNLNMEGLVKHIFQFLTLEDTANVLKMKSPGLTNGETFAKFAIQKSAFIEAIQHIFIGHSTNAQYLLENYLEVAKTMNKSGEFPVHLASRKGDLDILKVLFNKDPELVNYKSTDSQSALHVAAYNGHLDVVKFIHQTMPEIVNYKTHDGKTALFFACQEGHLDIVSYIAVKEPHLVKLLTDDGQSVLHPAANYGHIDIVKFLTDIQPELVKVKTNEGRTAQNVAAIKGHSDLVRFLQQKVSPNTKYSGNDSSDDLSLGSSLEESTTRMISFPKVNEEDHFYFDNRLSANFGYLKSAGVPLFSLSHYFKRNNLEENILIDLKKVSGPNEGMLVIYGEVGVGKSTVLAKLLQDTPNRRLLSSKYGINRIIWLNCIQWLDHFDETSFYEQLIELAREMDADLTFNENDTAAKRFSFLLRFYKENHLKCVFVFDDVFDGDPIKTFIRKHGIISKPILIAITRDLQSIEDFDLVIFRKSRLIEGFSDEEIKDMLKTSFKLDTALNDRQHLALAERCYGLPLITDMVASQLNKFDENLNTITTYNTVIENWSQEIKDNTMNLREKGRGGAFKTVYSLFSTSLDSMDSSLRMSYYAFLLFNPSEHIGIIELAVLWGFANSGSTKVLANSLCKQYEKQSLISSVKWGNLLQTEGYLVHQTLFECAIEKAAEDLGLSHRLSKRDMLYKIRFKIITGAINRIGMSGDKKGNYRDSLDSKGLGILVDAVNLELDGLVKRIFQVLSLEDTANILKQKSKRLTNGESFVQFAWQHPTFAGAIQIAFLRNEPNAKFLLDNYLELAKTMNRTGEFIAHLASRRGSLDILKVLFKKDPQLVNYKTTDGRSALHIAAYNGHKDIVRFLLDKLPEMADYKMYDGKTALFFACQEGYLDVVTYIAKKAAHLVKLITDDGQSVLHPAASYGHIDIVKFLTEIEPELVKVKTRDGRTAQYLASNNGHSEIMAIIQDTESSLNFQMP